MSLISYIERLRTQSEEKRRRVAFFSAGAVTVAIFLVWLSVTRYTLSHPEPAVAQEETTNQTAAAGLTIGRDDSALAEAKERLGRGWQKVKESFSF